MGKGTSSALGPPRPLPHGCRGVFRFGTTEASAEWALGGGLLRLGTIEALAAWARGHTPL